MKYLLDTCALLWFLQEPEKLSSKAKMLIETTGNEVCVSTVSFWELSLKHSIGKLPIEGIELEEIEAILIDDLFVEIITLSEQESLSYHRLPYVEDHRDPFDRMLAWQAIKRNMVLVSNDSAFEYYRSCGLTTFW
ncbi:MAG: type II toxin-antitoxin system VapC family toxin [Eggerthellaceae bacterium]|jgi:PIN domain nuclease of toxin-antitoxin system|nr:type II toxin-antitoxin system VapC family toxin [Eggerthellaceae bacterium]